MCIKLDITIKNQDLKKGLRSKILNLWYFFGHRFKKLEKF